MFVAGGGKLGVWHGLDANGGARKPDVTPSGSGPHLDASANVIAVATGSGRVNYFAPASSLTSDTKYDTLKVAPALYGMDLSDDARTLAAVGDDQVYLIDHGAGGLSLRAALPIGGPSTSPSHQDVVLVE